MKQSKILSIVALLLFCGFAGVDKFVSDHHQQDKCSTKSSPDDPLTYLLVATVIVHCAYIVMLFACSVKMLHCASGLLQEKDVKIFYDSESRDITIFTFAEFVILVLTSMAVVTCYMIAFSNLNDMHSCLSTYSMSYYVLNTIIFAFIGSIGIILGAGLGLLLCVASVVLLMYSAGSGIIELSKIYRQLDETVNTLENKVDSM